MLQDKVFVKWRDSMSVGVKSIDNQHKILVGIINSLFDQLIEPVDEVKLAPIFKRLRLYTSEHFKYEEKILEELNWPDYKSHKNEHEIILKKLAKMEEELLNATDMDSAIKLMEFLKEWLVNHIVGCDKSFGKFLNENGYN